MEQQKREFAEISAGSKSTGKRKVTVGSIWDSKNCGPFEVISIHHHDIVLVRFLSTGYKTKTRTCHVRSGNVRDKYFRSVFGIGFIGDGPFKSKDSGKVTMEYRAWKAMLSRCYDKKTQENHPTYIGCTVSEEWHNFQSFAKWFHENYPHDRLNYDLDKDMKKIGNKVYSPDWCMFISMVSNRFITDCSASRGEFMIGVSFIGQRGLFKSCCRNPLTGKQDYLGVYTSEIEAHLAWRERKSELAYELAMTQDREEVKQALLNWKEALDNKLIHPY
jgi:hypothetical protein